jgi:hypothetical protein
MTTITESGPTPDVRPPTPHARLRRLTRVAGSLYLVIFVVYPLATMVRSSVVVAGDAAATAENIKSHETLYRWGMAGEATIVLVEVVLAAVLYTLLRPVSRSLSLAASMARVAEAVVMAAGCLVTSAFTLVVVSDEGYLTAFDADQRDTLALLFQEANDHIVLIWGFFFALSLALTGWLVLRSGFLPRLSGVLLLLAGVGYFVQSFGTILEPGLTDVLSLVVLVLAIPGELVFAVWLLVKGVDEDDWRSAATSSQLSQL